MNNPQGAATISQNEIARLIRNEIREEVLRKMAGAGITQLKWAIILDRAYPMLLDHRRRMKYQPVSSAKEEMVNQAITETAGEIRRELIEEYDRYGPGYRGLHRLIGQKNLEPALRIAGPQATIQNYNTLEAHRQVFETAHRENPNATVLWFAKNGKDTLHTAGGITPEYLLEQARKTFDHDLSIMTKRLLQQQDIHPSGQSIWETLCQLDQRAFREHPPRPKKISYVRVARLVCLAGERPHPAALGMLLDHRTSAMKCPDSILIDFIRESARKPRRGRQAQTGLNAQLQAIGLEFRKKGDGTADPGNSSPQAISLRKLAQNEGQHTWREWLEAMPTEVRNAGTGRKTTDPAKRRAITHQQIMEILRGPARQDLTHLLETAATLRVDPGRRVELSMAGQTDPELTAEISPRGGILIHTRDWQTGRLEIPGWDTLKRDRGEDDDPPEDRWSTRGLEFEARLDLTMNLMRENWKEYTPLADVNIPNRQKTGEALRHFTQEEKLDNGDLLERLTAGIRTLARPEAWLTAQRIAGRVTTVRYNLAAEAPGPVEELLRSNPGALAWAAAFCTPGEPVNHPGQIIRMARESMALHHLPNCCWKFASQASILTMREITASLEQHDAAFILRVMAGSGVPPDHHPSKTLIQQVQRRPQRLESTLQITMGGGRTEVRRVGGTRTAEPPSSENIVRALGLLCRAERNGWTSQEPDDGDVQNVMDYVQNITRREEPIRSTTWEGLIKKSTAWRRRIQREPIMRQWQNLLNRKEGKYLAWNSLTGPTEMDGLTATPLTDDRMLYQESLEMLHCVISYGESCARGGSRIFSIRRDGQRLATGEIRLELGEWQPAQVRAVKNHQPHPDAVRMMEHIAREYRTRYRAEGGQQAHRSWQVENQPEPAAEPPD